MNKGVKGEKAVRKAYSSVPVRYATQQYPFINLDWHEFHNFLVVWH